MSEQLEMMKAMASLYRKKAAVMKALEGGIVKEGKNDHFKYKFMTASTIKHTVGQLFADHGIALKMSGIATENIVAAVEVKDYQTKEVRLKEVPRLRIQFSICLCDTETGAVDEAFWFGEADATDDKAASKAATSALKYFLISNFMIGDKDEDERDTDASKPRPRKQEPSNITPLPQAAPHWSLVPDVLARMYATMAKDYKASEQDVNAAIRASLKPLVQMTGDQVTEAVKQFMSMKVKN